MEVLLVIAAIAVVIWVVSLKNEGEARGEKLASDFNSAAERTKNILNQIIYEAQKTTSDRLSTEQFHQLVESAADEIFSYIQLTHQVSSKINQASGNMTKPLAEFQSEATAEFAVAIASCIDAKQPSLLLETMEKYLLK